MSLETILVAVGEGDEERTEPLARTAMDIAEGSGAAVRLVHVFSKAQYEALKRKLEFSPDSEATPDEVAKRHVTIRDLGDILDGSGVGYSWHGAIGEKGKEVVDLADELDADLVIVGGRKRTPTGKVVFGSTAQEIMLNAPCPVTFVRVE